MSKSGSANGSFFGNYDQLLRRRPHFLFDLSRAVGLLRGLGPGPLGAGAHR